MKLSEAAALIRVPLIDWARPQSWCDLGCGGGTFTIALAGILAPGSTVYAVDFDQRALARIPDRHNAVEIRKTVADLRSASLRLPSVDGTLMANSLHFIEDQVTVLKRLLAVTDYFLIVEYERTKPSPWVPYPVGYDRLRQLLIEAGAGRMDRVATRPSLFGGSMYSALARRPTA
jgi:ubiquinone/menaquinone biosynthesis C-methylase UbiE